MIPLCFLCALFFWLSNTLTWSTCGLVDDSNLKSLTSKEYVAQKKEKFITWSAFSLNREHNQRLCPVKNEFILYIYILSWGLSFLKQALAFSSRWQIESVGDRLQYSSSVQNILCYGFELNLTHEKSLEIVPPKYFVWWRFRCLRLSLSRADYGTPTE